MSKIRQMDPKISKKYLTYCKNPTHDKKTRDLASKSYCWSPNLLGISWLRIDTICSNGDRVPLSLVSIWWWGKPFIVFFQRLIFLTQSICVRAELQLLMVLAIGPSLFFFASRSWICCWSTVKDQRYNFTETKKFNKKYLKYNCCWYSDVWILIINLVSNIDSVDKQYVIIFAIIINIRFRIFSNNIIIICLLIHRFVCMLTVLKNFKKTVIFRGDNYSLDNCCMDKCYRGSCLLILILYIKSTYQIQNLYDTLSRWSLPWISLSWVVLIQ